MYLYYLNILIQAKAYWIIFSNLCTCSHKDTAGPPAVCRLFLSESLLCAFHRVSCCHTKLIWLWKTTAAPSTASTILLPMDKRKWCPGMWFEWMILPLRSTSAKQVTHKCQYQGKEAKLAHAEGIIRTLPFRNVTPASPSCLYFVL